MGPRFFKRGDDIAKFAPEIRTSASMGPRFFKRGDLGSVPIGGVLCLLQWGHASLSVETLFLSAEPLLGPVLQWGHASLSVETSIATRFPLIVEKLQWGHASLSVETSLEIRFS